MPRIFLCVLLVLFLSNLSPVFARDPYPLRTRIQYPYIDGAVGADPATMKKPDGTRSDIISFYCTIDPNKPSKFLNDPGIDTLEKATQACNSRFQGVISVNKPYLKNNKNVTLDDEKYDINGYDWPIGDFLESTTNKPGFKWVTPLVYESLYGTPLSPSYPDCFFKANGPDPVRITRVVNGVTQVCFSPPYTTAGSNWWNWLIGRIDSMKPADLSSIASVGIYLGIDGEGRPLKSGDGWKADDPDLETRFYRDYVPAVLKAIKDRYQGKVIRGHTDEPERILYLENGLDFHRESLNADGQHNYLYKGLGVWGWWQGFANYYYVTNTQGLQSWPPMYQTILAGLSMHTDMITGYILTGLYDNGKGDILKFAGDYMGKNINDTPGVWSFLRETIFKKEAGDNTSGKYGDYDYYLYRAEDLANNQTEPVGADTVRSQAPNTIKQIYSWNENQVFGVKNYIVGRKNKSGSNYMSFDIDDGYRYAGKTGVNFDVRLIFLDVGGGNIKFQYKNTNGEQKEYVINKQDSKLWKEVKFTLFDAYFNNNMSDYPYPTDFRLETNGSTIHLIEVRGSGNLLQVQRPKAQISCDIADPDNNNPTLGVYSMGFNRNLSIRAKLLDNNNNPIPGERVMFTYNTEWNLAKSAKTDSSGLATSTLSTTPRPDSSGFVGGGYRDYQDSTYSIQAFYPGSANYQPSRNDCYIHIVNSPNKSYSKNTRMQITNVNTSQIASTGKISVSFDIYDVNNQKIASETKSLGRAEGFFSDDPNSQTIPVLWNVDGYFMTSNHVTVKGSGTFPSEPPYPTSPNATPTPANPTINLKTGLNYVTFPHFNQTQNLNNLPSNCKEVSLRSNNFFFKTFIKNFTPSYNFVEGKKYYISCSQNSNW